MDVAVVDFTSPDAPAEFTNSLRETGFAVVTNHPLDWALVETIYREWAELFDSEAVNKYLVGADGQVGYFPMRVSETAKGAEVRDLKEFFHVYDTGAGAIFDPVTGASEQVAEGAPVRSAMYPSEVSDAALLYRRAATELACTLLGWVEANTPPDVAAGFSMPLSQMLNGSKRTLLRVLRYPPLPADAPERAVRAAAHEDINLLTVLPASDQPGLELLGRNGEWFAVPLDPGSIAVNGGEMLDLASGGYFPATTHRVVNPTGAAARVPRMSLPLFLHPADDVVLAEGRTAWEFLQQRLLELRGADFKNPS